MAENSARVNSSIQITNTQRVLLLITTVFGHCIKHAFSAAFFILIPEIKTSLGFTNSEIGGLSAIRNVLGGLANLPGGFLADRFSQSRALILGVSFACIGIFAFFLGLSTTFWQIAISSSFMVIAITFWHPAALSALSVRFADRRGFAISLHGTGGSIGEAIGPIVTGLLLASFAWVAVAQGMIVPSIVLGVLFWLVLRKLPMQSDVPITTNEYVSSLSELFANRRLLIVLGLAGGYAAGQSVFFTFFPIYMREDIGSSTVEVGIFISLAQVAGIVAQPLMGYLSDRLGRKAILTPSFLIMGVSLFGLYVVPASNGVLFLIVIVILGTVLFSTMAILLAAAGDLVSSEVQGTTISLVFGTSIIVAALSPYIGGIFADWYGVKTSFLWASGIVMFTAITAFFTKWAK